LIQASICGSIEVVDVLVRNKADFNLKDKDGQTAYSLGKKLRN
jgi:ankyrin repeat protein